MLLLCQKHRRFCRTNQTGKKLKTLLSDHALMNHPKVLITPHIAFNTQEARLEIITATLNNIRGFLEDEPQNIVTS